VSRLPIDALMEVLLVEKDPLIRDQVKVGLQQFPEFHVTVGKGHAGINEARSRVFDCVFVGVDFKQKDTLKLLQHLRSFDTTSELFVLTAARNVRDLNLERTKYNIHTFVPTPLVLKDFFGLVGRFLERRLDRANSVLRKGERAAVGAGVAPRAR
jgi:DNA-binding NtrC family response regulator